MNEDVDLDPNLSTINFYMHLLLVLFCLSIPFSSCSYPSLASIHSSLEALGVEFPSFPSISTVGSEFCTSPHILCEDLGDEGGIQIQKIRVRGLGINGDAEVSCCASNYAVNITKTTSHVNLSTSL
jgi:hypothetical protein